MAPADLSKAVTRWKVLQELLLGIAGVIIIGSVWYVVVGLLLRIEAVKAYASIVHAVQYGVPIAIAAFAGLGAVLRLVEQMKAVRTTLRVATAFDDIKRQINLQTDSGIKIAQISVDEIAEHLKDLKIGDEKLKRLVDQEKQKALIDDEYFRQELSLLFVRWLQPLPRNAKRLLNRLRVNQLIAYRRDLFTTEPRVSTQQIGKWLVLMERWPQLGRSLSAAPDKIITLEMLAAYPAPPPAVPGAIGLPDAFMDQIKSLSPFYVGDEDLREFLYSTPPLGAVVARLAHFAGETSAPASVPAA